MRKIVRLSCVRFATLGCLVAMSFATDGCANHPTQSAAAPTTERQHQVIVRLVSRNYSVVICEGPQSPLYTIRGATGELLARNLTLNELRDSRPDLYNSLAPALSPKATVMATKQGDARE
jgi:hypothetical protein